MNDFTAPTGTLSAGCSSSLSGSVMTSNPPTQPTLLFRLRDARDIEAWGRFVDLYVPLVYGFLRKTGLQDADAADLTQDVLRQVAAAVKSFEYDASRGSFRKWLFTIVQNRLTDHWRKVAHQEQGTGDTDAHQRLNQIPQPGSGDSRGDWDADYDRQILHYAANTVKRDFTSTTWLAFWLTAVEGLAGQDVARQLNLSLAAVYLAKGRVMKRLKDQIRCIVGDDDDGCEQS